MLEDFSTEPQEVVSESVEIKRTRQSETGSHDPHGFLFLLFYFHSSSGSRLTSNKFAFEASKKKVIFLMLNMTLISYLEYKQCYLEHYNHSISGPISRTPSFSECTKFYRFLHLQ